MRLHPFRALHARPDRAADVASPPYDVVSTAEARALAEGRPHSFLHVVRSEIDLPASVSPYDDRVYAGARAALEGLVRDGLLVRDAAPALWLYRLDMRLDGRDHAQVGFVGCAEVADYRAGRIKQHEHTRRDKEDDRTRHVDAVGAHAGPVFLTCRARPGLAELQGRLMAGPPLLDVVAAWNGVRHRMWRVGDAASVAAVAEALAPVDAFYIADGHHRAASAARVRDLRRERDPGAPADAPFERFLAVVFPHDQLRILAYNRVLADLGGRTPEAFLAAVAERFEVGPPGADPVPRRPRTVALYLDGAWRLLAPRPGLVDEADAVARLDVAVLQDHLLAPLLGIEDPRSDPRIDFVGGIRGAAELARRVDEAGAGCAFSLHPTSLDELLAVADAGRVMPPKSTWFEPKLASGLVVHPLA